MARPCFTLMTPVQAFITETSFAFANQKQRYEKSCQVKYVGILNVT